MLQQIRDRAQGVLVWTIVGLIIITFALFGLSSYLSGGGSADEVAQVNDTEITQNQLLRAQRNYLERLRQIQGEQFDSSLFDSKQVRGLVLQGLIQQELIQQHINQAGYQPPAEQVLKAIHGIPVFQENGTFSRERYRAILNQEGISPEQFERNVASDLAAEEFTRAVTGSSFVTDAELKRFLELKYQQRDIGYMVLELDPFINKAQPSEDEVAAFYEKNRERFMTSEKVSINYIDLNLEDLASKYEVSQQEVEQYYDAHRNSYVEQPEQRTVSHILIAINADRNQSQALAEARQIRLELAQGANFAELARKYSDDPGSAMQGGNLGQLQPGIFDPDFENAAVALAEGDISEPVKTQFGYHLIRVDEVKPATIKPLAEVEKQIQQELRMRQAEQEFYEKVDALTRYSYEMPDSLQGVAEQVGLKVEQSPWFTRQGGDGLTANPKVVTAAFSDEVLKTGRNSEVLELSDTRFIVLRVDQHQPARARPLEQVKEQIVRGLKQQQAQQLAMQAAGEIEGELKNGTSPQSIAARDGITWQAPGFISRRPAQGESLDMMIRRTAFDMPAPTAEQPSYTVAPLSNGNVAVVRLQSVRPGELPSGTQLTRERQQLSAAYGVSEYESLLESLRSEAEIKINDKALSDNEQP